MRCRLDVAPVRAEPDDASEQVTQLLRLEPVRVAERRDEWTAIVTAYDYPGWVRDHALEPGEGRLEPDANGAPLEVAHEYAGTRYLWGGLTTQGIDCSGLVHMAYRRVGRLVPRDADQQEAAGVEVDADHVSAGDLVTYGPPDGSADHIAFWLGDGRILHASGREGVARVLVEAEPPLLRDRRRKLIRL